MVFLCNFENASYILKFYPKSKLWLHPGAPYAWNVVTAAALGACGSA